MRSEQFAATHGEVAPLTAPMSKKAERRCGRPDYDLSAILPALAVTAIEALYRQVIDRRRATIHAQPAG